jgi:uncharacterized protein YcfJ
MKAGSIASILTIAFLAISSLTAAVVPGRWEKVESLSEGTALIVELNSGDRLQGALAEVNELEIVLLTVSDELRLLKTTVVKVTRMEKVNDRAWDGAAGGAFIGAVIGGAGAATAEGSSVAANAAVGAAIGGLIGFALDKVVKKTDVLYVAP